jgi:hypothetical protein
MKNRKYNYSVIALIAALILVMSVNCKRDFDELELATYPKTAEVFIDGFSEGLIYSAFGGSKVTAFDVDNDVKYKGEASMRFEVPDFEDPEGAYAGGAYYTTIGRDLSGYDALTFWAKASKAATLDVVGLGNDFNELKYLVSLKDVKVNTNWKKYIIPIPDPSKLTREKGMFYYAEGPEDGWGYTFWIDEVKFEKLGTIAHMQPAILEGQDQEISANVGDVLSIDGLFVTFNMPDGTDQRIDVAPAYFNFSSSDTSVAKVNESGNVSVIQSGNAIITASLRDVTAKGSLSVEAIPGLSEPAPTPTTSPENVISLFSNAYTNVNVDTWNPYWQYSTTQLTEKKIGDDDVKYYTNLNFVGIEFVTETIDATDMTHLHLDILTQDPVNGAEFSVEVVDFGADDAYGGGNDTKIKYTVTPPTLVTNSWIGIDVPLAGLVNRKNVAQLVLSSNDIIHNVYVDNVYFYKKNGGGTVTEPTEAAPTPLLNEDDVISLFSDAYTDVTVDTWRTDWSSATLESVTIAGNPTKKYSSLDFVGIETLANPIDVSGMTHFHIDVWSADFTFFGIKLVDFGADGTYAGGDDVEHQVNFNTPQQGEWISYDIPLNDFTNLTTKEHMAQYILVGKPTGANTIYIDNIYFHK